MPDMPESGDIGIVKAERGPRRRSRLLQLARKCVDRVAAPWLNMEGGFQSDDATTVLSLVEPKQPRSASSKPCD